MCGIVGFQCKKTINTHHLIKDMLDTIRYRGPDEEGHVNIDDVHIGHVRLAIIDLEHGQQPMQTADGRYTLALTGEIYNYLELRQHLKSKGYMFKTHSDTEVLLNMYVEYREKALDYLNGMFAFIVYDKVDKILFLARDHFGIKPLYYYCDDEIFAFASEIKALLKHPRIKASLDTRSLFEYLTFQMVLGEHTLFKNIHCLEPATFMKVKDEKIAQKKEYWQLDYTVDDSRTEEGYADELLLLLQNSTAIQTRSDVPVGAYLSGGLDSSIVSVLASRLYYGQFSSFTGAFKDSGEYDESNYAKVVSDSIGSNHHLIYPTPNDFAGSFEKLVYHMDEPAAGPGLFPQFMVSKMASEQVKVVLGGTGGDEVFGGYARYAVAYLEQCLKGAIFETQEEGKHVVTLHSIIPNMAVMQKYVPMIQSQFSSGLFENMDRRYFRLIDRSPNLDRIYNHNFLRDRNEEELFSKFSGIFNKPDTRSYFNKMTYFDIKTLLPALLQVEDRASMAVSLESRVPLLDKRIVELSAIMPPFMKFAGGKIKYMLAKAVKNVIPKEILQRKDKMGFPTPINEWLAGPLKEFALDILTGETTRKRGLINRQNVESMINNSSRFGRDLWGALNIEMWFRTFIDT